MEHLTNNPRLILLPVMLIASIALCVWTLKNNVQGDRTMTFGEQEALLKRFRMNLAYLKIPRWKKALMSLGVALFLSDEVAE